MSQPQWHGERVSRTSVESPLPDNLENIDSTAEEQRNIGSPSSLIEGQGSYDDVDALFGDD